MVSFEETHSPDLGPEDREVTGMTGRDGGVVRKMSDFRQAISITALLLSMFLVRFAVPIACIYIGH